MRNYYGRPVRRRLDESMSPSTRATVKQYQKILSNIETIEKCLYAIEREAKIAGDAALQKIARDRIMDKSFLFTMMEHANNMIFYAGKSL